MHKATGFGVIILLILNFLFISGCVTTEKPIQNSTPTMPEKITEQKQISLQNAISTLQSNPRHKDNLTPIEIRYIRGINITQTGTAEEWTIGATQENSSFFFIYDGSTESFVEWPDMLEYDEIIPGQFVYPDALFSTRPTMMKDLTNDGQNALSELELVDGLYTLSTESRQIKFNPADGYEIL